MFLQWLLTGGCLLSVFSIMMLSLCKTYYQIFLAQAIGLGLGIALQCVSFSFSFLLHRHPIL